MASCVACLLAEPPLATMLRPVHTETYVLGAASRSCEDRSRLACASKSIDDSLFSTVLLVVILAVGGASFIMAVAYLLGEDHNAVLHPPIADGAHALLWAVKQSTRGCATMC
ncbi:uncharacterized protein PHACADRAFT_209245 [Phanerochaete carnosa HHB-10118-sp]|uniref:Uncharacterized protein n=1 Tax=Phanerochaete carnosa (strain HHB-10118-sp) TaxID=650164 RepID=K5W943_PHACS|nr:uncharacterized protein PHACADRAFT_209245 [Phanerochaete carnosa HHB-10118-sp]EKM55725.1 hypothetical protein PHACADRAFT_209245 [Phanerochaete carnosa HHB-10118-sp]